MRKIWRLIVSCHGQDAKKRKGKLRLDEGSALEPRNGVAAIVPGNLEESEAWQRTDSDDPDELDATSCLEKR